MTAMTAIGHGHLPRSSRLFRGFDEIMGDLPVGTHLIHLILSWRKNWFLLISPKAFGDFPAFDFLPPRPVPRGWDVDDHQAQEHLGLRTTVQRSSHA